MAVVGGRGKCGKGQGRVGHQGAEDPCCVVVRREAAWQALVQTVVHFHLVIG